MTQEMESIYALNSFKSILRNKKEWGNDSFRFEGLVTYSAFDKVVTEILEVELVIGGFEPMIKLDLDRKGRIITSVNYHLDFNPRFEKTTIFSFDEINTIKIEGKNSPKMGNYEVTIKET